MFKTSILALLMSTMMAQNSQLIDLRPTKDILSTVTASEGSTSSKLDLTAEAVTPLFKNLRNAAVQKNQTVEKSVIHKLAGETINNTLYVTYRVVYTSDTELDYKIVLKAPNTYAQDKEERVFTQTVGYKCNDIELQDANKIFLCIPQQCELQDYKVEDP